MDKVRVTQADREAAGKAYENRRGASATMHSLIVSGRNDGYYLVQAFARHRIEATRQAEEQNKLLRKTLQDLSEFNGDCRNLRTANDVIRSMAAKAKAAVEAGNPAPGKRCPTCGDAVVTIFDHLGTDCETIGGDHG